MVYDILPTTIREHAILVRSLGVSQLVVAVNKLDTVDWNQQRFTDIRDKLRLFLTKQVHLPVHHLCSELS
jgi:translation elongation factor EF-1alpha